MKNLHSHIPYARPTRRLWYPAPGIRLHPLQHHDATRLLALFSDKVCDNLAIERIHTLKQAQNFVHGDGYAHKVRLGIWHKKHGLVGSAAWGEDTSDSAFISYWVAPAFQRHGYGRLAVTQLVRQLKQQGFHQILADVYFDNLPSKSLLINLGFRIEGTLEEYEEKPILRLMLEGDNQPHGLTQVSFHPLSS
ncbi:Acetyltransferase (GNAT) family protein [Vibrio aerogenes CECT 7868]|uniref:Acetyltransferase (GNAT) family protein n=1 Tax=Vibrio aerogenes CECT 7868 TaxID=1216006 RepID=A0A1M5ZYW7_9VIBR|nr:GNAT family N-acetyltransferase [Vibrio aerogenes]SHI29239.1 Acetyltransferase (GNAT) family protein [Vibrio aerogenes CECT 7868]